MSDDIHAIDIADSVVARLKSEMDPHIDQFINGSPDVAALGCAAARVVGAQQVRDALANATGATL